MSYTVIARRYRPQTFEEVIGQSPIATTLQNAIKENKVSHAYIFAGERGVGKTSLARIIAKALNCKSGPTTQPCNKCEFCKSISEGNDADVIEIDAASRTKVEDVRTLQEGVSYVPLRARYKIYILDEAHQLSISAFNALLKTIEEPPPHVKFIFATTQPHKLPETIISRCQRFNFRRISPQDIYQHLEHICRKEKVNYDKDTLALVAQLAQGSMRDAESILDQLISFGGGKIATADIEALLGAVSLDEIFRLVDAVHQKNLNKIVSIIDDAFTQGKDMAVFFDQIIEHLWRLILVRVNPKDAPLVNREIVQSLERYEKQANYFSVKTLLDYIQQLADNRWRLKDTTNIRILTELTLLKMVQDINETNPTSNPYPQPTTPAKKTQGNKTQTASTQTGNPVAKPPSEDADTVIHTGVPVAELGNYWPKIMEEIRKTKFKVHAYMLEARFLRADNQEVVISLPPHCSFHRRMLEDINNKKIIEDQIQKVTGQHIPLTITVSENNNSPREDLPLEPPGETDTKFIVREKADKTTNTDEVITHLMDNPIIRKIQEEFNARVIRVDGK